MNKLISVNCHVSNTQPVTSWLTLGNMLFVLEFIDRNSNFYDNAHNEIYIQMTYIQKSANRHILS